MTKRAFIYSLCAVILAMTTPQLSSAQRTAYGERQISVNANWTVSSFGGEAYFGQYLTMGYWFSGLGYNNRLEIDAPTGEKIHFPRLQFFGGYMYRLYGTKIRNFNIYAGGDFFIGAEILDAYKTLTEPTKKSLLEAGMNEVKFIYGPAIRAEAELFVSDTFAITAKARVPFCLNTNFSVLSLPCLLELSVGARVNF